MLCLMNPEERIPKSHPLRQVKQLADEALSSMDETLDGMYSKMGRPSVPPEQLLKSLVLCALYSIRSERSLCEQLRYNLLFQWFLDLEATAEPWVPTTYSKNRERLLEHDVARKFFGAVVEQARGRGLLSEEHFSVDGTLVEAWASLKSFRPKDEPDDPNDTGPRNRWMDYRGKKRSNETHESKTDPEAKLMRKSLGKEAKLTFGLHALMEHRNGLWVDLEVTDSLTRREREAGLRMLERSVSQGRRTTVAGDKGYDNAGFVDGCRDLNITPHVAQKQNGTRLDGRTTRHEGYRISQRIRKRAEELFGWSKTTGGLRKTRFKGKARTGLWALFVGASYNLLRMAKMEALETS